MWLERSQAALDFGLPGQVCEETPPDREECHRCVGCQGQVCGKAALKKEEVRTGSGRRDKVGSGEGSQQVIGLRWGGSPDRWGSVFPAGRVSGRRAPWAGRPTPGQKGPTAQTDSLRGDALPPGGGTGRGGSPPPLLPSPERPRLRLSAGLPTSAPSASPGRLLRKALRPAGSRGPLLTTVPEHRTRSNPPPLH